MEFGIGFACHSPVQPLAKLRHIREQADQLYIVGIKNGAAHSSITLDHSVFIITMAAGVAVSGVLGNSFHHDGLVFLIQFPNRRGCLFRLHIPEHSGSICAKLCFLSIDVLFCLMVDGEHGILLTLSAALRDSGNSYIMLIPQMFYNLLLEKDVEITVEFEDVPADAWYAKPVNTLASLGILSGVGNGRFDPERSITRAEFTVIAMKFANTSGGGVNIFSDVNEDDWFYSAVVDSTQYGWINGYPDGTFRPDNPITREQFFKITVNFLSTCGYPRQDSPATSLDGFADAGQLSSYALPCARLLVELGIVKGSGNLLSPKSSTQCQQALVMFYRTYGVLQDWMENPELPDDRTEAQVLVEFAMQYLGYDYIWGGKDPSTGFDCSGFVWYVYTHNGYPDIGRTATDQWYYDASWEVSADELLPGDLLFFSETGSLNDITHIGIYVGDGEFIHAANSRDGVILTAVSSSYYVEHFVGARRIIP